MCPIGKRLLNSSTEFWKAWCEGSGGLCWKSGTATSFGHTEALAGCWSLPGWSVPTPDHPLGEGKLILYLPETCFTPRDPRDCSAAVEVQELALTMEVPQGQDSRSSSRNRSGGNWLLNDYSVITQFLLHPHLSISLFGKISAWLCPDIGTMQHKKSWSLKWLCHIYDGRKKYYDYGQVCVTMSLKTPLS